MVAWWCSKANKIWFRILALVVCSVFFFTQVVGASVPDRSFWTERRKARQKLLASREKTQQSDRRKGLGEKLEQKDVAGEVSSLITSHNLFTIPSQYGTVKEIYTQGSSNKRQEMGNRLIIHIQDAHSSSQAQLNSANILKYLQKDVAKESTLPLLICVEGSSGLVDTTLLSSFPEKKIKEEVASEFLKEGKITGEEYFAITGGEKAPVVNIYGVEDKRRYEKNLKAFEQGLSSGEKVRSYFRKVKKEINPLKARLYNKRLKELESKIEAYQKKKISLTQYAQYLYRLLQDSLLPLGERVRVRGKYPNFELFVQASKFEKKIDFSKVNSERSKYIKELSKKLTNDELSDLLIMSLDYRLGKVTSGGYYTYLQSLSSRMGKGVRSQDPRILTELVTSKEGKNEYPNLNLYIKYNKLYDRIDQNKLFSEISELQEEVKERLCETEEERELVKLSRMLKVLNDLVSLKISNEDLAYYYRHRDEITPGMFSNFITTHNGGGHLPIVIARSETTKQSLSKANLSKFEEFYRIALKRNEALVDNTISRMEKEGVRVAVLIAGGFHTPGITELLRDKNISYVVVTPRLGEDSSSDLEISPRKKRTDLEKAIAGIVGTLRPANILGDESFQTCSVIRFKGGALFLYSQFEPKELRKAFSELLRKWRAKLVNRPKLRQVIENVEFLPVVLTREEKAFALGVVKGKKRLPFVLAYDIYQKKFSEVIFGEYKCRKFLLSDSFDNAAEAEVVKVAYVHDKLKELWPFLTETEITSAIFGKVGEVQTKLIASKAARIAGEEGQRAITEGLQKRFDAFEETRWYRWLVMVMVFLFGELSTALAVEPIKNAVKEIRERPEIPGSFWLGLFGVFLLLIFCRYFLPRRSDKTESKKPTESFPIRKEHIQLLQDGNEVFNKVGEEHYDLVEKDRVWSFTVAEEQAGGKYLKPAEKYWEKAPKIKIKNIKKGYRPKHKVPAGNLTIIETDNPCRLYTFKLSFCAGLALKGKRNGKNVLIVGHLPLPYIELMDKIVTLVQDLGVTDIHGMVFGTAYLEYISNIKTKVEEINREKGLDLKGNFDSELPGKVGW